MSTPVDATGTYGFIYSVATWVGPLLFNLQVENAKAVPFDQGGILASNHPGGFDFLVLGMACRRQIHYMAKIELFQVNPLVSTFLRSLGVFPVRRGERDMGALETALGLVQSGRILGMFPEGTRNRMGKMTRGRSGVARIALAAKVPVIPAGIVGAGWAARRWYRQWQRPPVRVCFGEPFVLDGDPADPSQVKEATTEIMLSIAQLLPAEKRGDYTTPSDP